MARGATPSTARVPPDAETAAALAEKQELTAGEAEELAKEIEELAGGATADLG